MYIKVRVKAGSKKENFAEKSPDHFEISVKQKAERNMANKRVIELVALHLHLAVSKIRIISGHQSPNKILSVEKD